MKNSTQLEIQTINPEDEEATAAAAKRKSEENDDDLAKKAKIEESSALEIYDKMTDEELYDRLKQVDPNRAGELHRKDRRKIVRSLEG